MIIVYIPHTCLVAQSFDPGCDYRSKIIGKVIANSIPKSKFISSRTLRAICDNNRSKCRDTPSRRRLRDHMKKDFTVLEIHTFGDKGVMWGINVPHKIIEVVILAARSNKGLGKLINTTLNKQGVKSKMLVGSPTINDVQLEVLERGGRGVLLEFDEDLSVDRAEFIGKILSKIVKK